MGAFDFVADYGLDTATEQATDSASSGWFDSFIDFGSNAFDYVNSHQWAADAIKGAAGAGLSYMQQRDQIKEQRRRDDKAYQRSLSNHTSTIGGNPASLTSGMLTTGTDAIRQRQARDKRQ